MAISSHLRDELDAPFLLYVAIRWRTQAISTVHTEYTFIVLNLEHRFGEIMSPSVLVI